MIIKTLVIHISPKSLHITCNRYRKRKIEQFGLHKKPNIYFSYEKPPYAKLLKTYFRYEETLVIEFSPHKSIVNSVILDGLA